MAKTEYDEIKKIYGEEFAKFCRSRFATIMGNSPGKLLELLKAHLEPTKTFMEDLYNEEQFIGFINDFYEGKNNKQEKIKTNKSAVEIADENGYTLYECKTVEDVLSFSVFYHPNDKLCTFNNPKGRLQTHHIFFFVRKDYKDIKRENYIDNPQLDDAYGLRIVCVQLTRGEVQSVAIISGWNHTVPGVNPNCTLGNNLDNFMPGLTDAMERDFGFNIKLETYTGRGFAKHYTAFNDKWYRYNFEYGNVFYCANNNIINNNIRELKNYDKKQYIVMGQYVLDKSAKTIRNFNPQEMKDVDEDVFTRSFGEIKSITEEVTKKGRSVVLTSQNGKKTILGLNKNNSLISFQNSHTPNPIEGESLIISIFFENSSTYELQQIVYPNDSDRTSVHIFKYLILNNNVVPKMGELGAWTNYYADGVVLNLKTDEIKQFDKDRFTFFSKYVFDKVNNTIKKFNADKMQATDDDAFTEYFGNIKSIKEELTPTSRDIEVISENGEKTVLRTDKKWCDKLVSFQNSQIQLSDKEVSYYPIIIEPYNKVLFISKDYILNKGNTYRFRREIHPDISNSSNMYWVCDNNYVIDNKTGVATHYDADRYTIFDDYIVDKKDMTIQLFNPAKGIKQNQDAFTRSFSKIKSVSERKTKRGKSIEFDTVKGKVLLQLDNEDNLISYVNPNITRLEEDFLSKKCYLEYFDCQNLRSIGPRGLYNISSHNDLIINLPSLEVTADNCFSTVNCKGQFKLHTPSWRHIGNKNFFYTKNIENIDLYLPSMESIGSGCFSDVPIRSLKADKLRDVGNCSLEMFAGESISLPSLEHGGYLFLGGAPYLKKANFPKLTHLGEDALCKAKNLETLIAPNLKVIQNIEYYHFENLRNIDSPYIEKFLSERRKELRSTNLQEKSGKSIA